MSKNFEGKKPVFLDIDRGIIGAYEGLDDDKNETEMVYPQYFPVNTFPFLKKKVTYSQAVNRKQIHNYKVRQTGEESQPHEFVLIYRGEKGGMIDFINEGLTRQLDEARRDIAILQKQVASRNQVASDAVDSYSKLQTKMEEATGKRGTRQTENNDAGMDSFISPFRPM